MSEPRQPQLASIGSKVSQILRKSSSNQVPSAPSAIWSLDASKERTCHFGQGASRGCEARVGSRRRCNKHAIDFLRLLCKAMKEHNVMRVASARKSSQLHSLFIHSCAFACSEVA
eukprot:2487907-Amphidinium_carterae.1